MERRKSKTLAEAPAALVALYDGGLRNGRALLGRLLMDTNMRAAWVSLARAGFTDQQYKWLWSEIKLLVLRADRPVMSRAEKKKRLTAIADSAITLANQVEADRQIDLTLDKYVARIARQPVALYSNLSSIAIAEVLRELAAAAKSAALTPADGIAGRVNQRESKERYVAMGLVRWMRLPRSGGGRPRHEVVNAIVGAIYPNCACIDSKKMESRR